jgi:integrase
MPNPAKGPRLWLQPASVGKDGSLRQAVWVVRDGRIKRSTGIPAGQDKRPPEEAERLLTEYRAHKYEPEHKRAAAASQVRIADVLSLYLEERAPLQAAPVNVGYRVKKLDEWWGDKTLDAVTGRNCRAYAKWRGKPVARRELQDLAAAIKYHRREGLCREVVEVWLPPAGPPRDRWLTRSEVARLIWMAWRYRDESIGRRRCRRHIARFILVAVYTGTRSAAILSASMLPSPSSGWVDLERGLLYRKGADEAETTKRRPPVKLPPRLLAHMRRWRRIGVSRTHLIEFNGPLQDISEGFRVVVKAADFGRDVHPHTLRHTCATWLMQHGTDMWHAAGFLGMTVQTLERVYGHHHPDFQQQAAANITKKFADRM